jgi:hypothetical protein
LQLIEDKVNKNKDLKDKNLHLQKVYQKNFKYMSWKNPENLEMKKFRKKKKKENQEKAAIKIYKDYH